MHSQLVTLAVAAAVGLAVGLIFRFARPQWCLDYAGWSRSLSRKFWIAETAMFAMFAVFNISQRLYVYAALMGLFAVAAAVLALRKTPSATST